jgi:hypothetical protein
VTSGIETTYGKTQKGPDDSFHILLLDSTVASSLLVVEKKGNASNHRLYLFVQSILRIFKTKTTARDLRQ